MDRRVDVKVYLEGVPKSDNVLAVCRMKSKGRIQSVARWNYIIISLSSWCTAQELGNWSWKNLLNKSYGEVSQIKNK